MKQSAVTKTLRTKQLQGAVHSWLPCQSLEKRPRPSPLPTNVKCLHPQRCSSLCYRLWPANAPIPAIQAPGLAMDIATTAGLVPSMVLVLMAPTAPTAVLEDLHRHHRRHHRRHRRPHRRRPGLRRHAPATLKFPQAHASVTAIPTSSPLLFANQRWLR